MTPEIPKTITIELDEPTARALDTVSYFDPDQTDEERQRFLRSLIIAGVMIFHDKFIPFLRKAEEAKKPTSH